MDTLFYLVADTVLAAYAGYSWYSQATVILRALADDGGGHANPIVSLAGGPSGATWTWNSRLHRLPSPLHFDGDAGSHVGFADKRVVLSGYFRRTLKYSEISQVI